MHNKIISGCLAALLLFSLSGCRFIDTPGVGSYEVTSSEVTSAQKQKEYAAEEAKKYLKEKYPDDDFTYVSAVSPAWGFEYYTVKFTSALFGDEEVLVYLWSTDSDNEMVIPENSKDYGIGDSYYTCKFKKEGIEYFDELLLSYGFSDYRLDISFPNILGPTENIDADKGFEYYYSTDTLGFFLSMYAEADVDEIEYKITELLSSLKSEGHDIWLVYTHVDVLPDKEQMEDLSKIKSTEQVIYSTAYEEENHFHRP